MQINDHSGGHPNDNSHHHQLDITGHPAAVYTMPAPKGRPRFTSKCQLVNLLFIAIQNIPLWGFNMIYQ